MGGSNMKMRIAVSAATVVLALGVAAGALFLSGALTSRAVQNPSMSIDMLPAGNSYSDPGLAGDNSMTVGVIDSSSTVSSNITHLHSVQLIIQNVEDLVGWQTRVNYSGDRMGCAIINLNALTATPNRPTIGF